ncbi:ExbD/TolR family protein [Leptolyngbya sp. PCC 6406]|uniref:ExbD/TolR family protein n=1 Tax=Leptolyngbya sp. PCC 6406 TaxID=1173264 RepID=UPI0002ABD637|nr:biopolymer transporter ExbD [Leptolyngbya sp. PCC 6406]
MKIDLLENPSQDVHIEILPLIDVIFCILTFFILAAVGLTRQQAIDLDLPNASTGTPLPGQGLGTEAALRDRLYVSVDAIGQVYLDQQPVTLDLLYDVLQQHQQSYPEGLIVLYASRDARYEDVVSVLDLLRSVGGNRVALATLPDTSPDNSQAFPEDGFDLPLPGQNDPLLPQPGFPAPGSEEFDPFAPENFQDPALDLPFPAPSQTP